MTKNLFKDLRIRVNNEINREIKEGVYKYREEIKLPKNLNYTKKRITEEVKNFNFEEGMYEEVMKIDEMVRAFITFFLQHTLDDVSDLFLELLEINLIFVLKMFNKAKLIILKKYSNKENDIFELEKNLYEKTASTSIFEKDEHIIVHFKGTVHFPKAHFEFPGHTYITNYRIIAPNIPKTKTVSIPVTGAITGAITGLVASRVEKHIIKARNKFIEVLSQNPEMFFFNNPYNIFKTDSGNLTFTMNYDFTDKKTSQIKVYKLVVGLVVKKYIKEANKEFKRRKDGIFSKIREIFTKILETVCPKCNNVQDKSLDKCENCGKALKFRM